MTKLSVSIEETNTHTHECILPSSSPSLTSSLHESTLHEKTSSYTTTICGVVWLLPRSLLYLFTPQAIPTTSRKNKSTTTSTPPTIPPIIAVERKEARNTETQ